MRIVYRRVSGAFYIALSSFWRDYSRPILRGPGPCCGTTYEDREEGPADSEVMADFSKFPALGKPAMEFTDKVLKCIDCGSEFIFTAGEQLFFHDKDFKNDPKRCKQCKAKRANGGPRVRTETRTKCSACGEETTVPFRPTQGRPVLCRSCFQKNQPVQAPPAPVTPSPGAAPAQS